MIEVKFEQRATGEVVKKKFKIAATFAAKVFKFKLNFFFFLRNKIKPGGAAAAGESKQFFSVIVKVTLSETFDWVAVVFMRQAELSYYLL